MPQEESPQTASSPIDHAVLDTIRGLQQEGGPNLVARVVGLYLEGSGKQMESLRNGVMNADAEAVHRALPGVRGLGEAPARRAERDSTGMIQHQPGQAASPSQETGD